MQNSIPLTTDIVLVGGGHAHVEVIRQFGMQPWPGVRLTVISRDTLTPYSGMLPGWIAGHYDFDDAHIDLQKLCAWAGVRLFEDSVTGLDLQRQRVHCAKRPSQHFDYLSINIGATRATSLVEGADHTGIAVKPIDHFMAVWQEIANTLAGREEPYRITVVGGGAAGVEVVLAMQHRLQRGLQNGKQRGVQNEKQRGMRNEEQRGLQSGQRQALTGCEVQFTLVDSEPALLPGFNSGVRRQFRKLLDDRGIKLVLGSAVKRAGSQMLYLQGENSADTKNIDAGNTDTGKLHIEKIDTKTLATELVIWALPAAAHAWLRETGLALDQSGFIQLAYTLQSTSHPNVFAAGDSASLPQAVAKSGVYAVRQGPVLAANLRRIAAGESLRTYKPQRRFLSLISGGDQRAVASWGPLCLSGPAMWRFKNFIDQRWMKRYRDLPAMPGDAKDKDQAELRCGGCAAKVSSDVLQRVLGELNIPASDDAAILPASLHSQQLQTVDYFRQFIDDPWLLGRIGANHCLGDIYAMGATPQSALAICTLPHSSEALLEDTLRQLLQGAKTTLDAASTVLLGGHTSEGSELAFGLSVNGSANQLMTKRGLRAGDQLVLTKALGTGTLMMANMLGKARADWISSALLLMQQSQALAAQILVDAGATGCTDITGFGLLGHLHEMIDGSQLAATIKLGAVPAMDGALESLAAGHHSSLHPANARWIPDACKLPQHEQDLLVDPQTAGGLLAGISAERLHSTLQQLHEAGYAAAHIGEVYIASDNCRLRLEP
ncbi:MAG: selenide, water dikinase SelD [Pseudomonadales bacterium]